MRALRAYPRRALSGRRGFSLIELLVVLLIIGILTAIAIPAVSSGLRAYQLTTTGQNVVNQILLARQSALSSSHAVQVRLYFLPDFDSTSPATAPLAVYRGMQSFTEGDPVVSAAGTTVRLTALTKPTFFPAPVVISTDTTISPILTTPVNAGDVTLPLFQTNYKYVVFRIKPDGSTDLTPASNTFTIVLKNAPAVTNQLPANYQTVQIDPMVGTVRSFRP